MRMPSRGGPHSVCGAGCRCQRRLVARAEAVEVHDVDRLASDVELAHGTHWSIVLLGVGLWGLHMGMTQGLMATMEGFGRGTRSHRARLHLPHHLRPDDY
jgi:hypothetical protein